MYTLEPAAFFGVLSVGFSIAVRLNTNALYIMKNAGHWYLYTLQCELNISIALTISRCDVEVVYSLQCTFNPLGLPSRLGDKLLRIGLVCSQNGTLQF